MLVFYPCHTQYAVGINKYLLKMAQLKIQEREIYELQWVTDRIWVKNLYISLRLRWMGTVPIVSFIFVLFPTPTLREKGGGEMGEE